MIDITKVKRLLILIMAIMLLAMPVNVLAATDGAVNLEGWENLEFEDDDKQNPTTPTTPTTPTEPSTGTNSNNNNNNNNNKNESLPQAGLAEDTIMVVSIIVLGTIAIYAYKKANQYNNI